MKCLIIIPSIEDFYFTPHRFSFLGARVAKDIALSAGWECEIVSLPLLVKPQKRILPECMEHLRPYMHNEKGPTSFFTQYYRFGPSSIESAKILLDKKPDVILFSLFAFGYGKELISLAREIKIHQANIPLIAAGKGVGVNPGYFQDSACFDFIITGEAETSLPPFLKIFETGGSCSDIPGLVWRDISGWVSNSQVLTQAENMHIPLAITGQGKKTISASLSITRGCTMGCRFCANHGDRHFRYPPAEKLISLIERELIPQIKGRKLLLNFEDDNLLLCPDYFFSILEDIQSKIPGTVFLAENGLDYRLLTLKWAGKLISLGFEKFNFTLGSFSEDTMSGQNRDLKLEHYKSILALLKKYNIKVLSYFIAGFKQDTVESIARTLSFLAAQPTMVGMSAFYPIPGIPGFEDLGLFKNYPLELTLGSCYYPWNASLSTQSLITAFRLTRFINLLKKEDKSDLDNELIDRILETKKIFSIFGSDLRSVPGLDEELVKMVLNNL